MAQLIHGTTINGHIAIHAGNMSDHSLATTSYVTTQINNLINGAPGALDTLNELAAALGNNASFSTSVTNSLAGKLSLTGGTMTGKILAVSTGTGTYDTAIELRETGYATTSQSAWGYSPAMTFHWGGRHAKRFGMRADGLFAIEDEPIALRSWVTSQSYLTSLPSHTHDDRYYTESESDAKYLIGTTNPGSVGNFTLSIGNNGSYSYVQSHSGQPLRLNPVGNAVFVDSTLTVSGAVTGSNLNISNWDTAYSWGNHASAGYLRLNTWEGNSYIGTSGAHYGTIFYDSNNDGYYLDPNSTSNLYRVDAAAQMRAPIFYDSQDTNYYLDPNSTSNLNNLSVVGYQSIGGQTSNGQSNYQWDGATYRNPDQWTARLILRRDNATTGINGSIPSLVIFNNNGADQTTASMVFATNECVTGSNSVNLAGIIAKKESVGNCGGWSSGSLNFFVKNFGTRVDSLALTPDGNATFSGLVYSTGYGNSSQWNTAYGWGNHSGLYAATSHTHDDRYYTESESDSRFVNADGDSMSGSLTIGAGAAYVGTHGTWTGEQNKIQWHSTHLYLQNTGGGNFFFRRADGTNLFNLDNNGSLIISGDFYPNGQGTYRLYVANSGLWTNGNFGASGDLYLGTRSTWLSSWLNQSVQTGAGPTFSSVTVNGVVGNWGGQTRDKLRVWDGSSYTIGMKSGYDYGHLGNDEYAMSFQMNNNSGRGFWWGDDAHSDDQGAASLTTDGRMVIATSLSIGEGESTVTPSSTTLYVKGSTDGADVLAVDGVNGRLFTITDSVLDTIYSVNTIAGLPILEVLANSTVNLGPFSAPIVINASGISTPSHGTSANWFTAFNKRPTGIGFSGSSTKTLTLTLGDGSTLTAAFNDIDTDTNTDGQTLSISGSTLTISGGNSITIPSGGISQATADGLYQPLENQRLSTSNAPTFADVYTNGWFRNNAVNTGLYNQSSGNHFYSRTAAKWGITGNGGNIHLEFRSNHESTLRGVVYADTSNQIGFLNNGEGWAIRANSSNNVFVHGTDLTINADNAGSSNINMNDGDHGARIIHCNSNQIGFLTQAGSWGAYCDDSGNWTAANFSGSSSGTNTGDQTDISGNSNTTSQRVFSDLKINFPSGSGGGYSFGSNHYSMGLDSGNGAWSDPHYRDLIIGYHTGIRIGANYSGVRFYSNSPTTDANNDGNGDGGEALLMTVGGYVGTANHTDVVVNNNLIALSSLRAPIFYDSNNTAHYVDPSGGSNIRNLYVGDTGSSWSDPGGWGTQITFSNGPHTKLVLQARTPGISAGMYVHAPGSVYIGSYSAHDVVLMRAESARMTLYSSYTYAEGYLQAADSLRAPIFYDSNDTAYYLDPNSTSELYKFSGGTLDRNDGNSLHVNSPYLTRAAQNFRHRNGAMGWGNYDLNIIASNWGSGFFDTWGSPANGPASSGSGHYVGVQAFHYNDSNSANFHGWQMVCAQEAANRWFLRSSWNTPRAWVEMIHSGNIGSQTVSNSDMVDGYHASTSISGNHIVVRDGNGYIFGNYINTTDDVVGGSVTGVIVKQGDNYHRTGNQAAIRSFLGLGSLAYSSATIPTNNNQLTNGAGYITSPGNITKLWAESHAGDYYIRNNWTGTHWHITSNHGSGVRVAYADDAGAAENSNYINSNRGTPSNSLQYWQSSGLGIDEAPTTDWHNTIRMGHGSPLSYYSNTLAIRMTGSGVGDIYTQTIMNGSRQGWKKHWNDVNLTNLNQLTNGPGYITSSGSISGNAATATTAARATRANGNFYIDDNYGNTVVGVYSASRLQGVFAMGDAYKLAADGSSAADHYGIAWSHPNAGGQASRLTNHGMLVQGAGTTWTAISDSIWCIGDITAFSDARVKANVEVIDNPLERLSKVRGVTFTRIDLADPTKRYAGVIAQEMREALPEVVTEDGNGELSVSYGNTVSLLIESIKAQQVQIEELKLEVKKLKGE